MKRKALVTILVLAMLVCVLSISVSAASTNEFGTVETSDKIDLTGMATDTDVRVVLYDGVEYHTYPSQYIVKNSTSIALDFSKINDAFGKSYETNSVIRLEVPRHVTNFTGIFAYDKNDNLVEIFFPWDANIKSFGWACFEGSAGLQKINFPKTVTSFSGNAFESCTSLKEVNFAEDSTLTALASQQMFANCKSLERIVIPHSVTSFGRNCFSGCTSLKEVVFSPNFTNVTGESMFSASARGKGNDKQLITIYVDDDFIADTTKTNKIISWDNNDMQQMVIMFTGTKSQAEAFVTKFSSDQHLKGLNVVEYDSTKSSAYDYLGMEEYTTDITVNTNRVLVYGYNYCDAFHKGIHDVQKVNDCVSKCTRCDQLVFSQNPVHKLSYECTFLGGFNESGNLHEYCSNEYCEYANDTSVAKIFDFSGYSVKESEPTAICAGFTVNHKSLALYKEHNLGAVLEYGIVALKSTENNAVLEYKEGSISSSNANTVLVPIENAYSGFDFILRGFNPDSSQDNIELVISAYIGNGTDIFYMSNTYGKTPETITLTQARGN